VGSAHLHSFASGLKQQRCNGGESLASCGRFIDSGSELYTSCTRSRGPTTYAIWLIQIIFILKINFTLATYIINTTENGTSVKKSNSLELGIVHGSSSGCVIFAFFVFPLRKMTIRVIITAKIIPNAIPIQASNGNVFSELR